MRKPSMFGFACVTTLISASAAMAAPLASDNYVIGATPANGEYVAGSIATQPGLVTPGFVTGGYTSGTGTAQFGASATGIDYSNITGETGGSVLYTTAARDNTNRSVARNLSPALNTTTNTVFYTSYLLQRASLPTAASASSFVGVGFANTIFPSLTTSGTLFGAYVGFSGTGTANTDPNFGSLVIRSRSGTSTTAAFDTVLVDGSATGASTVGTTYFVVLKNTVNSPTDSIEYWVNPGDVDSEASMTASSIAHNTINTGNGGGYQYNGGTTDVVRLNYASLNWDGNVRFDEPRLGLALRDVAVPEPTTLAAIAGGLLALRRRRRA